jgi:hypothetical protein
VRQTIVVVCVVCDQAGHEKRSGFATDKLACPADQERRNQTFSLKKG